MKDMGTDCYSPDPHFVLNPQLAATQHEHFGADDDLIVKEAECYSNMSD